MKEIDPNHQQKIRNRLIAYYVGMLLLVLLFNWLVMPALTGQKVTEVPYSQFLTQLEAGDITAVSVETDQVTYSIQNGQDDVTYYKAVRVEDPNLVEALRSKNVEFSGKLPEEPSVLLGLLLSYGLPILVFVVLGYFLRKNMSSNMSGSGFSLGMGKDVKIYEPSSGDKTFADVAGQDEAKESLEEIVDYLENPGKYSDIGASCPKGILLVGPPGTGKTLMAKAVAGEANVPFFSISGSEFVEMFVGRGAAKVRDLFEQAKKQAPCIVFIDEIDTIGKRRDSSFSSNDEREQTLNQLLTEMDGFEENKVVIILAATNRPEVLDLALLRPGRFDRQVHLELPDLKGRVDVLKVHAKRYKMAADVNFDLVARATAGASGAQLANILNEAALRAVRLEHSNVTQEDLEESIEVIIAGQQRKNAIMSAHEKRIVAYHEVGHALVAAKQSGGVPVHKITIVPRTSGALGYTMQIDEGEKVLVSRKDALNRITVTCGGRAAEELVFEDYTTGASNDIEQATKLARSMVTKYGMTDTFDMMALQTEGSRYLGEEGQLNVSPETARQVDEEVLKIIRECHQDAHDILKENEAKLHEIAAFLEERETITGEEFMEIVNAPLAKPQAA